MIDAREKIFDQIGNRIKKRDKTDSMDRFKITDNNGRTITYSEIFDTFTFEIDSITIEDITMNNFYFVVERYNITDYNFEPLIQLINLWFPELLEDGNE